MRTLPSSIVGLALLALVVPACSGGSDSPSQQEPFSSGPNPFTEDQGNPGKADTEYFNPNGIEVEVDLEADVTASSGRIWDAPAELGQFALTYLRKRGQFYLESLAEDSLSDRRVEWRVNGTWMTAEEARKLPSTSGLNHFRLRGVNAVLLRSASQGVQEGTVFTATVPTSPYTLMTDVASRCADSNSHITLDSSVYWYLWNPDKSGCDAKTQDMTLTVSKMFPTGKLTYPEYDQLIADGKVTAVVLFGQVDDGEVKESDYGMQAYHEMAGWLEQGGYEAVASAPVGMRYAKKIGQVSMEIDLYSPRDFAGLGDYAHFANLERAVSEHEIVVYRGHSMLGASDFWSRPDYPDFYQIFLYGGCLGYEYYIRPIVEKKNGWAKLDMVSSVVEVSVMADPGGAFLAKLAWSLDHGYSASWKDLLGAIRNDVGDSTFGASGVRDNCYSPSGSLCGGPTEPTDNRWENKTSADIPDNNATGISSVIEIPDSLVASALTVELDVTHSWIGDLQITLEHEGKSAMVWDFAGGNGSGIAQTFTLPAFAGADVKGAWTLRVVDGSPQDTGTLNTWALVATP